MKSKKLFFCVWLISLLLLGGYVQEQKVSVHSCGWDAACFNSVGGMDDADSDTMLKVHVCDVLVARGECPRGCVNP